MMYLYIISLMLLCFQARTTGSIVSNSRSSKKADTFFGNEICHKKEFDALRHNSQWKATETYLKKLITTCMKKIENRTCNAGSFPSAKPVWSVRTDNKKNTQFVQFNMENVNKTTDCWLFAFIAKSNSIPVDTEIKFYEFNDESMHIKYHYKPAFNYTFRFVALPTNNAVTLEWVAPDGCELEVMHDIQTNKKNYDECKHNLTHEYLMEEAKTLCGSSLSTYERRRKVDEELKIVNCRIVYSILMQQPLPSKSSDASGNNRTVVVLVVVAAVALLVVSGALVSGFYFKRRKRRMLDFQYHLDVEIEQSATTNGTASIMIVHRPGCEHLDHLIQQFSALLMSYSLDVKTTFDGCDLSAEGGIASYLQRNLQKCDFVLVFITEKMLDTPLLKHRPFEFSLKLMEGVAIHEPTKRDRFIPVYLSTYHKSVGMFPPFLKATDGYGYSIPRKTDELICKLLRVKKFKKSEDRLVKDKLFYTEMGESCQSFMSAKHKECNKENCNKGAKHASHTNLSSIWATTVHTKWKSAETLDDDDEDENKQDNANEMKNLQFQKALQYVNNMTETFDYELSIESDEMSDVLCDEISDVKYDGHYGESSDRNSLLSDPVTDYNGSRSTETLS